MSEFITVQVGQCGNQIGSAFWPLVLHEYGIANEETSFLEKHKSYSKNNKELANAFSSFFYVPDNRNNCAFKSISDLENAEVKARAILVDMEDSVVARFRQGPLRNLFDQTCTVTNYPGSGNNWLNFKLIIKSVIKNLISRVSHLHNTNLQETLHGVFFILNMKAVGYYTHGIEYHDRLEEAIRLTVEKCDCLHGFMLMHSLGGGTGSGLGTATLKMLDDFYPHVDRFVSCVYPASTQDVVTAPYNVLLATQELIEHATCVFPAENRALQEICNFHMNNQKQNLSQAKYNASCLPFQDMNSIIVNMLLHLTSGSRFPGSLNTDMNELATNLVAYPQLHYIFSSVSPVALTAPQISIATGSKYQDELFTNAWSKSNHLLKIDPLHTKSLVIGAAHIYRGDSTLTDIRRNIDRFKKKANFTAWSNQVMKIGLCSIPPPGHPASLLCMINSTSMSYLFKDIIQQFDVLYRKKAHIHHYLEIDQFEKEDFIESRDKIINVFEQYIKIEKQSPTSISRLQLN